MVYVFDIDGTICKKLHDPENDDYGDAVPYKERIERVNNLYDQGHTIIFQTARGMGRNDNNPQKAIEEFYSLTKDQLGRWGCKYHMLFLGKPAGDIYVDDKGINDEDFFTN